MTFTLAANAEMLFLDQPFRHRVELIRDAGFDVEIWNWTTKDVEELRSTGARFSSMTGYVTGDLVDEQGAAELLDSARHSLDVAERLGCPRLNLHGTGLDTQGLPVTPKHAVEDQEWSSAVETLRKIADLGEAAGKVFTIENLNTRVDHPGTPFASSEATAYLVQAVDSPGLKMNVDLYHCQVDEGNLIERTRQVLPWVGEIQVADVPGRREPGTGEINYPGVADALRHMGFSGTIALEAWASEEDSVRALERFREAFSL